MASSLAVSIPAWSDANDAPPENVRSKWSRSWLKFLEIRVKKKHLTPDAAADAGRLLERHIFPRLGARPIAAITPFELLTTLKDIEVKGLL